MVAGLFGFPASTWDTRIAKRFVFTTFLGLVRRRRSRREPIAFLHNSNTCVNRHLSKLFQAQHSGLARRSKASGCEVIFESVIPSGAPQERLRKVTAGRAVEGPRRFIQSHAISGSFPLCSAPGTAFSVPNARPGLASADSSSQSKLSSWIDASA